MFGYIAVKCYDTEKVLSKLLWNQWKETRTEGEKERRKGREGRNLRKEAYLVVCCPALVQFCKVLTLSSSFQMFQFHSSFLNNS